MPTPWLFNAWGCNSWATEPDRSAAEDLTHLGITFSTLPSDIIAEPLAPPDDQAIATAEWFAALTGDWPPVPPLIPLEAKVSEQNRSTVLDWVNASLPENEKRTYVVCFHMAAYQLSKADMTPSGPPARSEKSFLLVKEFEEADGSLRSELQVETTVEAVTYLKESLVAGRPSLVGLRYNSWERDRGGRPNDLYNTPYVVPTNHFIVVVGMGTDRVGPYFSFYDYLSSYGEHSRFYLKPNLAIETTGAGKTLTEVRRSYRLRPEPAP